MSTDALIADRIEIADLSTRLARLLDEKRWEDAGTVFTDDVAVHSPRGGVLRGLAEVVAFLRRDDVEDQQTQHTTTDLLVDVEGDHATASANSTVYLYRAGQAPTSPAVCGSATARCGRRWAGASARCGSLPPGRARADRFAFTCPPNGPVTADPNSPSPPASSGRDGELPDIAWFREPAK